MDAKEFKDFIIPYLPISFEQKSRSYFIQYLLDALVCNWNNGKYQFSLLSANILFMTIIFRDFWFDDKYLNKQIVLNEQLPKSYYRDATDYFNLSKYNEKLFLESYLKSLGFDTNEIKDIKNLIDYRDHCAHASGKIYYNYIKVAGFLKEYTEAIQEIENRRSENTIDKFYNLHKNNVKPIKEFVKDLIFVYSISIMECKNLIGFYDKIEIKNDIEKVNIIILKYFLKCLIGNKEKESRDTAFQNEIKIFIENSIENTDKIYEMVESEIAYETDNFNFNIISFDDLKWLFVKNEKTLSKEEKDIVNWDKIIQTIKNDNYDMFIRSLQKILNDNKGNDND